MIDSLIAEAFGVSLCQLRQTPQGQLESKLGTVEDAIENQYCNDTRIVSIILVIVLTVVVLLVFVLVVVVAVVIVYLVWFGLEFLSVEKVC